jgi:hypothetical protein
MLLEKLLLVLVGLLLASAGIMFSAWIKAFTTPDTGDFDWNTFWKENKKAAIFTFVGLMIIIPLSVFVKGFAEMFKTISGLDVTIDLKSDSGPNLAYFTLGVFLYATARNTFKLTKPPVTPKQEPDAKE